MAESLEVLDSLIGELEKAVAEERFDDAAALDREIRQIVEAMVASALGKEDADLLEDMINNLKDIYETLDHQVRESRDSAAADLMKMNRQGSAVNKYRNQFDK